MSSDATNLKKTSPNGDKDNQKNLEREIKEMVSLLTNRLTHLQTMSKSGSHDDDEDDSAVKIITLAGNNVGVTMTADLDDIPDSNVEFSGEGETMNAYVNSNFQAVNNSVMLGGSCTSDDPGVHLDIVEGLDYSGEEEGKEKKMARARSKGKQPLAVTHEKSSDGEQ